MSTLEINESEYCIKLSKEEFDLTLIRQLIKRIQSERLFFQKKQELYDEDIVSRVSDFDGPENYDRLSEK
ncbi:MULTISPECIES: hypothetical protein [Pedobacter]|uniref:hypothetical protein n=1 Tax=Pedobacter TaxID=84567 RepID=UPI002109ACB9|nr:MULTISPECIES: hypothetical protein [unclassified Pedobacter]